jgi:hypothetical protein
MAASPRQSQSSLETERDGDSIGADGPAQRYTHATGRPLPLPLQSGGGTFVSLSGLDTSAVASTPRVSMTPAAVLSSCWLRSVNSGQQSEAAAGAKGGGSPGGVGIPARSSA